MRVMNSSAGGSLPPIPSSKNLIRVSSEIESEYGFPIASLVRPKIPRALALIWLIFFSPAFYRRWINGNAPVAKADEG